MLSTYFLLRCTTGRNCRESRKIPGGKRFKPTENSEQGWGPYKASHGMPLYREYERGRVRNCILYPIQCQQKNKRNIRSYSLFIRAFLMYVWESIILHVRRFMLNRQVLYFVNFFTFIMLLGGIKNIRRQFSNWEKIICQNHQKCE